MDDYRKIPEGPRGRDFVEEDEQSQDCSEFRITFASDPDLAMRISPRWHMKGPNGETFIMYGNEQAVMQSAIAKGYTNVTPSGFYSYKGNEIVDGKDGPWSFEDRRPSGGGSRGAG